MKNANVRIFEILLKITRYFMQNIIISGTRVRLRRRE